MIATAVSRVFDIIYSVIFHFTFCLHYSTTLINVLFRGTWTWFQMLGRLLAFAIVLLPGWYHLMKYYLFSPLILRNLEYGKGSRNRNLLDVYLPERFFNPHSDNPGQHSHRTEELLPVVVFVSGGAWTIGYKLWSALTARGLSKLGILTVVPDYRNFPQGDIDDMMEDVNLAMEWTSMNVKQLGGDPDNITLAGQSAGAHICLCLLISTFIASKCPLKADEESSSRQSAASEEAPTANLVSPVISRIEVRLADGVLAAEGCQEEMNGFKSFYSAAISSSPPHEVDGIVRISSRYSGTVVVPEENCLPNHNSDTSDDEIIAATWKDIPDFSFQNKSDKSTNTEHFLAFPAHTSVKSPSGGVRRSGRQPFALLSSVRRFIGVSGPYNLTELESHFQRRGLDASILRLICGGNVSRYSPVEILRTYCESTRRQQRVMVAEQLDYPSVRSSPSRRNRSRIDFEEFDGCPALPLPPLSDFPPVSLIHGSNDRTIPVGICMELQQVLSDGGCKITPANIYQGWSHTDAILESPLNGDCRLFRDIRSLVYESVDVDLGGQRGLSWDNPKEHAMITDLLANIARAINPF